METTTTSDLPDLDIILTKRDSTLDSEAITTELSSIESSLNFLEDETPLSQKISKLREMIVSEKPKDISKWKRENNSDDEDDNDNNLDWMNEEDKVDDETWYNPTLQKVFKGNLNNLIKARKLYQTSCSSLTKLGYFYKLKDKSTNAGKYEEGFLKIWEIIKNNATKGREILEAYARDPDVILKNIAVKLLKIGFLEIIYSINSEDAQEKTVLKKYIQCTRQIIIDLSKQLYFREMHEKGSELRKSGSVYAPGLFHSWGVNLSWLLAHLKKGSDFIIISDILKNKYRRSSNATNEHSAFLREVCACLKANYTLKYCDGKTTLYPSKKYSVDSCFSNGAEGNGVNTSYAEIEKIFAALETAYTTKKDFTFNLHDGLVFLEFRESPEFYSLFKGLYSKPIAVPLTIEEIVRKYELKDSSIPELERGLRPVGFHLIKEMVQNAKS